MSPIIVKNKKGNEVLVNLDNVVSIEKLPGNRFTIITQNAFPADIENSQILSCSAIIQEFLTETKEIEIEGE